MTDPLSITTGILALLSASKVLYEFIDRITDAPNVLESAKSDLESTAKILEDLRQYMGENTDGGRWSEETVGREQALRPVLLRCLETCNTFKAVIEEFVKNSNGRMKVWDRTKLASKEKIILAFREEIGSTRQSIGIAVSSLVASMTSYQTIQNFHRDAVKAVSDINRRLKTIQTTLEVLRTSHAEPEEEMKRFFEDQKLALEDHLRLCNESLTSVDTVTRSIQVFGNTKTGHGAKTFQGITTSLQGGINQTYGDSDLGPQSYTWMGVGDSETVSGFFQSPRIVEEQAMQTFGQSRSLREMSPKRRTATLIAESSSTPTLNLAPSLHAVFGAR